MPYTGLKYLVRAAGTALIEEMQAFPKQAADAARIVPPGQPGHAFECARRQNTCRIPNG
jgi:hypothetical protein